MKLPDARIIPPVRIDRRDIPPFLIGIASLPVQAILVRELLARGGGNELTLTLYLAIWLAGSALGARLWERSRLSAGGLVLIGGLGIASTSFALARLAPLAGSVPGEIPRPGAILWIGFLVLFPASFFTAGLFPIAARIARSPGRAYIAEAVGAVVGGVGTTILFVARVQPLTILTIVFACVLLASLRNWLGAIAAGVVLVAAIAGVAGRLDRGLFDRAWEDHHRGLRLLAHAATPTRMLTLAGREGERWLLADDAPREVLDDPYRDDAIAALLLASAPRVRSLMLVDFGSAGVAPALLRAGADRVVCLLPDREDTLLVRPARGIECRIGDPRRLLRRARETWDVIAIAGGEATSVSANRLWTVEAFAAVGARLSERGVVVAIAPGGSAAPGPETRAWRERVAAAMHEAIGPTKAIDADRFVLVASRHPGDATLDADSLALRFRRAGWRLPTYPPERFALEFPRDRLRDLPPSRANSDACPAAFAHALARWMRMSGLAGALPRWLVLGLIVLLVLFPLVPRRGTSVLVATGATSMGLDLLVLMAYQARVGLLQAGLGGLLGAFLGGTALGAWIADRRGAGTTWLARLCLMQVALAAGGAVLLPRLPSATVAYGIAALLLGLTCGLPFPIVARAGTAARAWAADAAGGILGAVLVLLVISRGFATTGLVLALLPLLAAVKSMALRTPGSGAPAT